MQAIIEPESRTVNFELCCPHCHKRLTGEKIVDISWRRYTYYFYTESGHQLCYQGPNLVYVSCLDTLNGEIENDQS
jgi:hypothetical protein